VPLWLSVYKKTLKAKRVMCFSTRYRNRLEQGADDVEFRCAGQTSFIMAGSDGGYTGC